MGCLRFKPGVRLLTPLPPAGAAILAALACAVVNLPVDLEVTSGSDGVHSGPNDPHHLGEAFDVHSKSLQGDGKLRVLGAIMATLQATTVQILGPESPIEHVSGGVATALFFGFLEDPGTDNEHFHIQRRHGRVFPTFAVGAREQQA